MDKSCIIVNEEGKQNPRKLLRDFTTFCQNNDMPVFVALYDAKKQASLMKTVLPTEIGINDDAINTDFDRFMKDYMIMRIHLDKPELKPEDITIY